MKNLLIDDNGYFLGAVWGTYSKKHDAFLLGNCFCRRVDTIYKDWGVA